MPDGQGVPWETHEGLFSELPQKSPSTSSGSTTSNDSSLSSIAFWNEDPWKARARSHSPAKSANGLERSQSRAQSEPGDGRTPESYVSLDLSPRFEQETFPTSPKQTNVQGRTAFHQNLQIPATNVTVSRSRRLSAPRGRHQQNLDYPGNASQQVGLGIGPPNPENIQALSPDSKRRAQNKRNGQKHRDNRENLLTEEFLERRFGVTKIAELPVFALSPNTAQELEKSTKGHKERIAELESQISQIRENPDLIEQYPTLKKDLTDQLRASRNSKAAIESGKKKRYAHRLAKEELGIPVKPKRKTPANRIQKATAQSAGRGPQRVTNHQRARANRV